MTGAIFDVDGTLLDSMGVWDTLASRYLMSQGIQPAPNLDSRVKTMSTDQAARYFQTVCGLQKSVEKIQTDIHDSLERFYREEAELRPGIREFLDGLSAAGIRMCTATATDRTLVEAALKRCGVLHHFDGVFTCDEIGAGKDEPQIYEAALKHLQTEKSRTFVFEDALHALETAKKAGFRTVGVFEEHEPDQEAVQRSAEYYVRNQQDLARLLQTMESMEEES